MLGRDGGKELLHTKLISSLDSVQYLKPMELAIGQCLEVCYFCSCECLVAYNICIK